MGSEIEGAGNVQKVFASPTTSLSEALNQNLVLTSRTSCTPYGVLCTLKCRARLLLAFVCANEILVLLAEQTVTQAFPVCGLVSLWVARSESLTLIELPHVPDVLPLDLIHCS